jgi:hypothetical protein
MRYGSKTTAAANSSVRPVPALEICCVMADILGKIRVLQELGPMRRLLAVAVVLHAFVPLGVLSLGSLSLSSSAAHAGGFLDTGTGLTGNDTGGIIQATPETVHSFKEIAVSHCGQWNRYAGITSLRRVYGDYIGFRCVFDRRYDPRKAGLPQVY